MRNLEVKKYAVPLLLAFSTLACGVEGGGVSVKGVSGADSNNPQVKTASVSVENQGQAQADILAQGAWVDNSGFTDVDVYDSAGNGVFSFGVRAGLNSNNVPFLDVHLEP